MDTNPYAPPKAAVADHPSGLQRRSVLLMVVLTIVTLGIYYAAWFFRRRAALNQLDSPRKLQLWPLVAFSAILAVELIVTLAAGEDAPEQIIGVAGVMVLTLARLIVSIVMIVQCFIIKDILEDHFTGQDDSSSRPMFTERVKLSGLMTFFFSIFYLQHVINTHSAASEQRSPNLPFVAAGSLPQHGFRLETRREMTK